VRYPFPEEVERGRVVRGHLPSRPGDDYGAFLLRRKGIRFTIIASGGIAEVPWEHVSVSTPIRCPTWEEMAWVKDLFFEDEEPVMQLHPPKSRYVNYHPHCLHLWKPTNFEIVLPPEIAIGPVGKRMEGMPAKAFGG
jgi:hypothetical protein